MLEPKTPSSQTRLPGADGLRAIACLMVVFSHLGQRLAREDQVPAVQFIQDFFVKGAYGVSVFFVLSGFLLSVPFWTRYLEQREFPDLREYVRRRAWRIVPGFYASLIVSFLVTMILVPDVQYAWLRLVSALTFTNAFHHVTFFPTDLNGPLWSIGFEVVCYVLMPLCMIGMFRLSRTRSSGFAWAYWIGVILLVLTVNQLIVTFLVPDSENRGWQYGIIGGAKSWMPGYNPVGMFAQYALGILAAGFVTNRRATIQVSQARAGESRPLSAGEARSSSWVFDVVALVAFLIASGILLSLRFLHPESPTEPIQNGFQMQPYMYPIFPGLVAVMLATLPFSRVLGRIFDNPFAQFTARVSFGLYVWHYLLLEVVRLTMLPDWKYFGIKDLGTHLVISAACLAVAYALATLSYRLIESPFLGQGKGEGLKGSTTSHVSS
jgi:peptidoglycan/LPS O-acetylase OafA/YrhL